MFLPLKFPTSILIKSDFVTELCSPQKVISDWKIIFPQFYLGSLQIQKNDVNINLQLFHKQYRQRYSYDYSSKTIYHFECPS